MPKVEANGITINYEQQGEGEPLILIPYLAADNACYAFQVGEYAKHFTCISVDPRGAGETDKPEGVYSTELFADDLSALMRALKVERAHISGLSLGAAVGMWLAAKYPQQVKVGGSGSVTETVIQGIFPWCFTPELYVVQPDYIESLAAFVRGRPAQPVDAFMRQSNAVIAHDVEPHLGKITAPTQVTYGRYDMVTGQRFAELMKAKIRRAELIVFEGCAHAPIYMRRWTSSIEGR